VKGKEDQKTIGEALQEIQSEDLVKYGLIPEFIGRLPVWATLDELDRAALIQILTEPKNSLVRQFTQLFEMESVELDVRASALDAIAEYAMKRKTGARGLRSILEKVLLHTMYEIPSQSDVTKVVVEDTVINGTSDPILIYESKEAGVASSESD